MYCRINENKTNECIKKYQIPVETNNQPFPYLNAGISSLSEIISMIDVPHLVYRIFSPLYKGELVALKRDSL